MGTSDCTILPRMEVSVKSGEGQTYAEGKKITWKDGIAALWCILRYRISD